MFRIRQKFGSERSSDDKQYFMNYKVFVVDSTTICAASFWF
jgi:hypothetical protein